MSWKERREADYVLFCTALRVVWFEPWSLRLRAKARAVAALFRLRLALGWHNAPPAWSSFRFHGNYCGPGHSRPGTTPISPLDAGCKIHDESPGYKRHRAP